MLVQTVLKNFEDVSECIRELDMVFIKRQSKRGMTSAFCLEAAHNHMLPWVWYFCWGCCWNPDVSRHDHKEIILIIFLDTMKDLYPNIYACRRICKIFHEAQSLI